jgi:putative transcriptional regulator
MTDDLDIPELTERDFKHMIRGSTRRRIMQGRIESGEDIAALRRFTKLSQKEFAHALEISVHTLRNWEQGRRQPEGPAIALLKIAARHPQIVRDAASRAPSSAKTTSR